MINKKGYSIQAKEAIITTLLYGDIFSFPLTKDELWNFLLTENKITQGVFEKSLTLLSKDIVSHNGYYCLPGREEIIAKREKNLPEVSKKMQRARQIAGKLAVIPTITFIGISGGLAVGNVTHDDDIDFFIIVKKNTLFVSRFLILLFLEFLGVRRSRNQKNTANTICVNLLIDETSLLWQKDQHDAYTAREIAQVRPLFARGNMYQRFLKANSWIHEYVPNVRFPDSYIVKEQENILTKVFEKLFFHTLSEYFFRVLQMSFIKRHQTKETATKHVLAFHPNDYRTKALKQLRLKARQFGLLTKV